jgi:hypothetical protein
MQNPHHSYSRWGRGGAMQEIEQLWRPAMCYMTDEIAGRVKYKVTV